MVLKDFVSHQILKLPFTSSNNFKEALKSNFYNFINIVETVDDEYSTVIQKSIQQSIENFNDVDEIISLVLIGDNIKAYNKFSLLIDKIKRYISWENKFFKTRESDNDFLFRARVNSGAFFKSLDLFHRPFEKRFNIPNSRFSLNGMPCLYLSNSTYTCWEECGRPELAKTSFSRFKASSDLKTLDFSYELEPLATLSSICSNPDLPNVMRILMTQKLGESLEKFIAIYPLYLATYTSVFEINDFFKPEYIFPQLIMQWIISNGEYDGVKYNSTKSFAHRAYPHSYFGWYNFAYPAKTTSDTGHCQFLLKNFSFTDPISWELLTLTEPGWYLKHRDLLKYPVAKLALLDSRQTEYHNTAFGKLETALFDLEFTA